MNKLPVLIPVHNNTFFVELQRVGRLLQCSQHYQPILLFAWPYQTRERDVKNCLHEGLTCLNEHGRPFEFEQPEETQTNQNFTSAPGAVVPFPVAPPKRLSLRRRIVRKIKTIGLRLYGKTQRAGYNLSRVCLGEFAFYLKFHRERTDFARNILSQTGAGLMIMAGDMVGYDSADFIKAAHSLNVPVVLTPSTMSNGIEQAEVYYHDPAYHLNCFSNKAASILFPRWVRTHRERKLLRRPAGDIFAMQYLKIAPPLPWIFNSGFADAICVESDAMLEYYLDGGLPRSQLVSTGSLANDVFAEGMKQAAARREQVLRRHQLPLNKPVILVAFPPDFLYLTGGRPECDFKTYEELTKFWLNTLRKIKNHNILLALHPSVPRESMLHLETENIKIGEGNTASLVPLCDIFVASVSSTIRWAIACGKPVVNYDVYRYRYTDYLQVPGVSIVEEKQDFENILHRLTSDPAFFAEMKQKQLSCAKHWGLLDGQVGSRMLELFDSLTKRSARAAA